MRAAPESEARAGQGPRDGEARTAGESKRSKALAVVPPPTLPYHRDGAATVLPPGMTARPRWTPWGDGKGPGPDGKLNKKPLIESNQPKKWLAYEAALAEARKRGASGVGYQIRGSHKVIVLDFDHVVERRDPLALTPRGARLFEALGQDVYVEFSPSGHGLRVFALRPEGLNLTGDTNHRCEDTGEGIEVYTGTSSRYATITGDVVPGREGKLGVLPKAALAAMEAEGAVLKRGEGAASTDAVGKRPELPEVEGWKERFFPGERWKRLGKDRRALLLGNIASGERSEKVASLIAAELGERTAEEVYQLLISAPGTQEYLAKHTDPKAFAWEEIARGKKLVSKPREEGAAPAKEVLAKLNERFAVVDENGRMFVITTKPDANFSGRERLVRYTFAAFREKLQPEQSTIHTGRSTQTEYLADSWLNWPKRRQYEGIAFDPSGKIPSDYFNLWRGWAVEPAAGEWSMLRDHIREVICQRSEELDRYVLGWLAFLVQHPEDRPEAALVLRGREGTGKSLFGQAVRALAGTHGFQVSNAKHLVGNFNAHLQNTLVLQADEAFFAGDRSHVSVLKSIITDPEIVIEGKGRDSILCRNRLHVIMTSNDEWVVPASLDARRFAMIDVSSKRKGDKAYFAELAAHVRKDETLAAMLFDLQRQNLDGFEVREVPQTAALQDQKVRSLDGLKAWLVDVLTAGRVASTFEEYVEAGREWRPFYTTDELHKSYCAWMNAQRRFDRLLPQNIFGKELGRIFELLRECRAADLVPGVRKGVRGYRFGKLAEARERFCTMTGLAASLFDEEKEEGAP